VSMREQMPEYWHFEVASGTKAGIKYDVYVQFLNLEEMIRKYAGDQRLWNAAKDNVDLRLLAAEILNRVDMRTSCSCPATLYWGQDYIRTQRDAQFGKQEERPPNIRNPRQYGAYCKHGQNVFSVLPSYTTTFASFLKKYWLEEITDSVELAKEQLGFFKKATVELGKREPGVRPTTYAKGGREIPPSEAPGEEPPEEELPPTPEEPPIGPAGPTPATRGAGEITPKATTPAAKKLGIGPEIRPKDKSRKGKYKPNESVSEKDIFKPASKMEINKRLRSPLANTPEARQDRLLDAHIEEGIRVFGLARWSGANIGWSQGEDSIASKVYGNPTMILTSEYDGTDVIHDVHKYDPVI